MKYLQGCNLDVAEVEARRKFWKGELADALAALKREGINTDAYTWYAEISTIKPQVQGLTNCS